MDDILQAALEAALTQEPLYVKAWKKWVLIRELDGEELGSYYQRIIIESGSGKNVKRTPNYKIIRAYLTTLSTRNPHPDCLPDQKHPHYTEYPGAVDENGSYLTVPHPKAGELVFNAGHVPVLVKKGALALGQISDVAMRLSGISDEEEDEERKNGSEVEKWETQFTTD